MILGTVIILGIFGQSIKTFRAMFLQTKESPYIEAARAYGASDRRIIFQYMMPRVIPVLIPQFILLIPSYVFLEASLAILGLGIPSCPHGEKSSMTPTQTVLFITAGTTGFLNPLSC